MLFHENRVFRPRVGEERNQAQERDRHGLLDQQYTENEELVSFQTLFESVILRDFDQSYVKIPCSKIALLLPS